MPTTTVAEPEDALELAVLRLGEEGDGVARHPETGAPLHVERALPGERVRVPRTGTRRAVPLAIVSASPDRAVPPCAHFGTCGGCVLQHLDPARALDWKRDRVEGALAAAGFAPAPPGPAFQTAAKSRRRMDLAAIRTASGVAIGLHHRGSREVVDLRECRVLEPRLFALIAPLRALLTRLPMANGAISIAANACANGIDLVLATDRAATAAETARLADFAARHGIARISWSAASAAAREAPETLVSLRRPSLRFGAREVEPPPGAFLQAAADAEAALVAAVRDAVGTARARRALLVELFAGCGTFTLGALDGWGGKIAAYEGDAAAQAALARAAAGLPVAVHRRDLGRQPLSAAELAAAEIVLLDPPHGGARRQMAAIAAARPPRVVMVSCDPASLGRDAAALAGAYRLASVRVVDQFLHSARVEAVCAFERA